MTAYTVGPGDDLAATIAACLAGDKVFFTGEHPIQHVTVSGSAGAPIEIYSDGTGRIFDTDINTSNYAFWCEGASYLKLHDFRLDTASKGLIFDTCSHIGFYRLGGSNFRDEGFHARKTSTNIYGDDCTIHDTGLGAGNGESFYIGQSSGNWVNLTTPDVTRYVRLRNCYGYRSTNDSFDIKEGAQDILLQNCTSDHGLGLAPTPGDSQGDSGYYSRGDRVNFENCISRNSPGDAFKPYKTTVSSVDYGTVQFVKACTSQTHAGYGINSNTVSTAPIKVYADHVDDGSGTGRNNTTSWATSNSAVATGSYVAPTWPTSQASPAAGYYTALPAPPPIIGTRLRPRPLLAR